MVLCVFFFQAEDGIRDLVRSRGLGDVYKRQIESRGSFRRVSVVQDYAAPETGGVRSRQVTYEIDLSLIHI